MKQSVIMHQPHIFWLFDWGIIRVYTILRWTPLYIRCELDQYGLKIDIPDGPLYLTFDKIISCERYVFSQGPRSGSTVNVKLVFSNDVVIKKGRLKGNILYLVVANPIEHKLSFDECDVMVKVLNQYRSGFTPSVSENPYEREWLRQGKADSFDSNKWNAQTSPHKFQPKLKLWQSAIIFLGIVFSVTILIMTIIGFVYNLLY